jgi:hypothetical protein
MPPGGKNAVDVTTDACARSCGFFMVIMALAGAVLACSAFFSCEFLVLTIPDPMNPINPADSPELGFDDAILNETISPVPSLSPTAKPPTSQSLGIFRYWDDEDQDCLYYDYRLDEIAIQFQLARLGISTMVIAALLATGTMLLEFCFCRFYCARTIVAAGCVFVLLGAAASFVLFFDPRCRPQDGEVNICERGEGANKTIAVASFYLATQILLCFTPKAVPMIRMMDTNSFHYLDGMGWCQCCMKPWKRLRRHKDDDIAPEEEVELIKNEDGHTFKQYHDETAGLTFQNQYTAAYKRWLAFEEDYETALARFKGDCEEASVDWREFLKKARMRQRGDTFVDETSTTANDVEQYLDEELLRFVDVLNTLRSNCDFAKGVMERIQKDINDQTHYEDEMKRRQAEKALNKNAQKGMWGRSKTRPEEAAPMEFQSTTGTIDVGESHLVRGTLSNQSFRSFKGDASIVAEMDQDGDVFKSARMGNRGSAIFKSTRLNAVQDGRSTGVNPSVVSSQDHIEEELSPKKQRKPIADFLFGATGIEWALNRVRRDDSGSADSVVSA